MEISLRVQDSISKHLLLRLSQELQVLDRWHFKIFSDLNDFGYAYIPDRCQFDANKIIKRLFTERKNGKVIAIVDIDLCTPVLTFVFGQAQLKGSVAVVSIHRLRNEYYNLTEDTLQLVSRLKKEIVHELGHLLGLYHCLNHRCVMNFSGSIINIDLKDLKLCQSCLTFLDEECCHE
ncbi:MAG TPA: archemetzincin [bacterium (Candidatus Stahlbacteria)]|nr:archemetzincin [Candidatus Stahlbacteria bacterium]